MVHSAIRTNQLRLWESILSLICYFVACLETIFRVEKVYLIHCQLECIFDELSPHC